MSNTVTMPILLEILPDGHLNLSPEQLKQAGLEVGDRLVMSTLAPGQLYLHKVDILQIEPLSREALSQLLREAFAQSGYHTREQIVNLVREVRQEMANER